MTNPVPGYRVTTPYRRAGKWWRACGWHTGVDFAAPTGTPVVAARPGVTRWRNYGSAFGSRQLAVVCADGSEDFYAHMHTRVPAGRAVAAGDPVGTVGARGNVTGPHLHFERHARAGSWSCTNMRDPQTSIDHEEDDDMGVEYHYSGKPPGQQEIKGSYVLLDKSRWNPRRKGLELAMIYLNVGSPVFTGDARVGLLRVRTVRENSNDNSSYHDYPIFPGLDVPQLITHVYFEAGDGGPTRYELKCHAGLVSCWVGTRYRKGAVIY